MAAPPAFDDMVTEVESEIFGVVGDFTVLQRVVLPMVKQPTLLQHYRVVCLFLYQAVSNGVVMTLCRLFDPTEDRRHASLANVLRRVSAGERETRAPVTPPRAEKIAEFIAAIPELLVRIEQINGRLAIRRSGLLAHRDMTKKGRPELSISWVEVREFIEVAKAIVANYRMTFNCVQLMFELPQLTHEPEDFLRWTRLDDFDGHYAAEMKRWQADLRRQHGIPDGDQAG